jgi:cellulose biosynthesis protein BcsQ
MNSEIQGSTDVRRLCEVVGIDPLRYVQFSRARKNAERGSTHAHLKRNAEHESHSLGNAKHDQEVSRKPIAPATSLEAHSGLREFHDMPYAGEGQTSQKEVKHRTARARVGLLSIAGGTGKTTIGGALAKILAGRGYSVLLTDYSRYNGVQNLFGKPQQSSTAISFTDGNSFGSPVPVLSRFNHGREFEDFESWLQFISGSAHFTFLDGFSDPVAAGQKLLAQGAGILVPVLPEPASANTAVHLNAALDSGQAGRVSFLLNRFDGNRPEHREVRARLREDLGSHLLPMTIGEYSTPQASELTRGAESSADRPLDAQPSLQEVSSWLEMRCMTEETSLGEVQR